MHCGDQKYKVHKLVICGKSKVFFWMFNGNWKVSCVDQETNENSIHLTEDHPNAVEAMIQFMYGIEYGTSESKHGHSSRCCSMSRCTNSGTSMAFINSRNMRRRNLPGELKVAGLRRTSLPSLRKRTRLPRWRIEVFETPLLRYPWSTLIPCRRRRISHSSLRRLLDLLLT